MNKPFYTVAVVGATGLVGAEIINVLAERRFPLEQLQAYASLRTAGDHVQCGEVSTCVELLDNARFDATDIVFLAAGEQVGAEWIGRAAATLRQSRMSSVGMRTVSWRRGFRRRLLPARTRPSQSHHNFASGRRADLGPSRAWRDRRRALDH